MWQTRLFIGFAIVSVAIWLNRRDERRHHAEMEAKYRYLNRFNAMCLWQWDNAEAN